MLHGEPAVLADGVGMAVLVVLVDELLQVLGAFIPDALLEREERAAAIWVCRAAAWMR